MKNQLFEGYVEKVADITFNVDNLYNEYKNVIEPKLTHTDEFNPHYKDVKCIWNNEEYEVLTECVHTQKAIKVVSEFFSFDSVVWRQLEPLRVYHWHTDLGKLNYHIPIITNPGCWFVFAEKSFQLNADGSIYRVNNNRYHTFANAGMKPRVHLIFENNNTTILNEKMTHDTLNFFKKKRNDNH